MSEGANISGTSALQREIHYIEQAIRPVTLKLRVAGYARVSSGSDEQQNSFASQLRYYNTIIEENEKWELVEVYADEAVTGTSTNKRDDFNRMLADCRKGKIDRIVTKSISRFARNSMDVLRTVRELKEIGVSVLFEKENIDTDKISSEVLLTLFSVFAQQESLDLSANVKKGIRIRMRSGTYVQSTAPYGYRMVDRRLEIYEPEAEVVQRIFAEYLAGDSTLKIAKALTSDGIIRSVQKPKWWPETIVDIIRNERYIGDSLLQKSYTTDSLPYKRYINDGELEKFYVQNSHEAIVDPMQFELANILLNQRGETVSRAVRANYPLSKKLICQNCGSKYRRRIINDKTYWVCRGHFADSSSCDSTQQLERNIYSTFTRLYNKLKANYKRILIPMQAQLEKMREISQRANPEIAEINKQIAALAEQNHAISDLVSRGIMDSALFISQQDEINAKIKNLKKAKNQLANTDDDDMLEKTEDLIAILENGPDCLTNMNEGIVAEMVESITIENSTILHFKLINGLVLTENIERMS